MDTLLTDEVKALIKACLFPSQTVEFDTNGAGFTVRNGRAFVHQEQFIPLQKIGLSFSINCIFPVSDEFDAHFCLRRSDTTCRPLSVLINEKSKG